MQYKWKRTLKMTAKASFNALDLKLSDPANIPESILGLSTVILAKFPCMWKNFFFFSTELFRTAENASSQGERWKEQKTRESKRSRAQVTVPLKITVVH